MRWRVEGIDIASGKPRQVWVDADTEEDAVRMGCDCYMIVSIAVPDYENEVVD